MRFGKRGRGRSIGRREASRTLTKKPILEQVPQDGSVAPAMDMVSDVSDSRAQEILTYLEHFSEQLADSSATDWTDACMNDLISCMEISVAEGWSDLAKVLTDTGRVLQTYENAQTASEAIPFLQDAYDAMCRLVGDIVIEKSTDETMSHWATIYSKCLDEISAEGLELFDDEADANSSESPAVDEAPIETAQRNETTEENSPAKTLPVLSELPPLDSLVSFNDYASTEESDENTQVYEVDDEHTQDQTPDEVVLENDSISIEENSSEDDNVLEFAPKELVEEEVLSEEAEEAPVESEQELIVDEESNEETVEHYDPPRIVVDIIDRICDVLGSLERDTGDARAASLGVMLGGLEALEHEAQLMKSMVAEEACITMTKACQLVSGGDDAWSDGLVEQGFAFCGVFIEALTDPASENISSWQEECLEWIASCEAAMPAPVTESEELVEEVEEPAVAEIAEEASAEIEETIELASSEDAPVEDVNLFSEVVNEAPTAEVEENIPVETPELEASPEATIATPEPAVKSEAPVAEDTAIDYAERSKELLQSAQDAALKGNAEEVKTFALRAAAEMAKAEVYKAEERLRESEIKLTQGIQNTEDARDGVKSCEAAVKESSNLVSESHQSYEDAQKVTADVVEKLEGLEAGVADLNAQIQELQARRDAEQEKVSDTVQEMDNKRHAEQQALSEWEELKVLESDSRQRLEEARQHVKDRQRSVQDIETDMEGARETMTREKGSLSDIVQTIQQMSGKASGEEGEENSMLF